MCWEKRNTVGKDRLDELTELYRSLGFEVKIEKFTRVGNADEACETCYGDPSAENFIIYTRKTESDT